MFRDGALALGGEAILTTLAVAAAAESALPVSADADAMTVAEVEALLTRLSAAAAATVTSSLSVVSGNTAGVAFGFGAGVEAFFTSLPSAAVEASALPVMVATARQRVQSSSGGAFTLSKSGFTGHAKPNPCA